MNVIEKLNVNKKTTITEKELQSLIGSWDYECFAKEVGELERKNVIRPVKSKQSGMNGRIPPLYNKYKIVRIENNYYETLEETKLLNPRLNIGGYLENPALYGKHRKIIDKLSEYLWSQGELLNEPMSQNERSYSVWGFEKLMEQEKSLVANVLKFNGLYCNDLNYFITPEPFIEYVHKRVNPMNVLIIENKDTWFSFRKVMLETGMNRFLDTDIHALLYGEGRKITGKSGRIAEHDAQWDQGKKNTYYYFGDLDYEGIRIYFDLKAYNNTSDIRLFKDAYILMGRLAEGRSLPMSADRRNRADHHKGFLEYFPKVDADKMAVILDSGRYIPQEIMNYQIIKKNMRIIEKDV